MAEKNIMFSWLPNCISVEREGREREREINVHCQSQNGWRGFADFDPLAGLVKARPSLIIDFILFFLNPKYGS